MQKCEYACGSIDHRLSRRAFLGSAAVGGLGLAGLTLPATARELKSQQKHVIVFDLAGGLSQLESWDPKPGTATGGPFEAIPTSVAGIHISELLPYTAKQMHHIALVRGLNSAEADHGKGHYLMNTGRRQEPRLTYPYLGAVMAKALADGESVLPGYLHITPNGGGGFTKQDSAFLGPRFASVTLGDGKPPANLLRPANVSEAEDAARNELRDRFNKRFAQARRTAQTEAYAESFDQAAQLMSRKDLFDVSNEPDRLRESYGKHDLGRHCLLARRLIERGATFVKVTHSNYDTHHENFDFHIEQLGEFDRPFATLIDDLHQRGLLQDTLLIVLSEMGRTPTINRNMGRDHWGTAWSVAMAGAGIKGGVVHGKTNDAGTAVTDGMVGAGHLFHTYLRAVGLDSKKNHYVESRPIPMADPKASPIKEVLA
jgi:uncharacterized protein (DUF1501 family)